MKPADCREVIFDIRATAAMSAFKLSILLVRSLKIVLAASRSDVMRSNGAVDRKRFSGYAAR